MSKADLFMKIEKNPVKIAYFTYISMAHNLEQVELDRVVLDKFLRSCTDEQLLQFKGLVSLTLSVDDIPDDPPKKAKK